MLPCLCPEVEPVCVFTEVFNIFFIKSKSNDVDFDLVFLLPPCLNSSLSLVFPFPVLLIELSESSEIAYFSITTSEDTPIGHIVSLNLSIVGDGNYSTNLSSSFSVGLTWEDFESGTFVHMPWNLTGNSDWGISPDAYEGEYSAQSGIIDSNENSELNISINVTSEDYISFFYKVSSESSYDYLRFYIDSTEMDAWSGEQGWSEASYLISTGEHTLRWVYEKDSSVDSGSDTAWIDYILFPPIGAPAFSDISISLDNISVDIDPDTESIEQFSIQNVGEG